jgi:hypothetical protein
VPSQTPQDVAIGAGAFKEGIVANSVVSGAVPVFLFVVPLTALMWVSQSVPREAAASKLALPRVAPAETGEEEFECDGGECAGWECPGPDPESVWRNDGERESRHSAHRF